MRKFNSIFIGIIAFSIIIVSCAKEEEVISQISNQTTNPTELILKSDSSIAFLQELQGEELLEVNYEFDGDGVGNLYETLFDGKFILVESDNERHNSSINLNYKRKVMINFDLLNCRLPGKNCIKTVIEGDNVMIILQ